MIPLIDSRDFINQIVILGLHTSFWTNHWLDPHHLRFGFQDFYFIFEQLEGTANEIRRLEIGVLI